MRLGKMIGDVAERIPFAKSAVMRARRLCRVIRGWSSVVDPHSYDEWVRRHDAPSASDLAGLRESIGSFTVQPTISVVMPVCDTDERLLDEAIRSVRDQVYDRWELCIADDVSTRPAVRAVLERHAAADARIMVRYRSSRGNISAASNTALEMATGDFVALFDHDDLLPPQALYWIVEAINRHPDAVLLYSDEDKVDAAGRRYDAYFKGDFNHELLLAQNMISHLGVYRRDLIVALGGFRSEFDTAQDHDLALRVAAAVPRERIMHVPRILYHWRASAGSTAASRHAKPIAADVGRRAVADHLRRVDPGCAVEPSPEAPWHHRVRHPLPAERPLVSIVICTRDHGDLLRTAVESITCRSTYDEYEILVVDNGSREPATLAFLAALGGHDRITVVRDDSPFNYSRLNNTAVARTRGAVVCLLNDDIEVLAPDWLEELVSQAIRPDVGAVGARLWYPDGTLQHGGVIIGIGGVAGHAHPRLPRGKRGYFCRGVLQQEMSAVTGACLAVRRQVFDEVGGLDEDLAVAFNDIDFCLRLRRAGYRNIWTPYAELVHHESASRGPEDNPEKITRFQREIRFMQARWGEVLAGDPLYNPNLSMVAGDFSLAVPTVVAANGVTTEERPMRKAG
jgi:GT2 family glycosyltransferase